MQYPKWSSEEEQILIKNIPKLSLNGQEGPVTKKSLLELLPNKSWEAIRWKSRQLSLRRDFKTVYAALQLPPEIKGYLAGLIDGEGCISFSKRRRDISGLIRYQPFISIANTNLELLKWVETTLLMGKVRRLSSPIPELRKKYGQDPWRWSFAYTWQISTMAGCYRLLTDLIGLLRIKKEQAQLILEFLEIESKKPLAQSVRNSKTGYFERRIAIPTTARQHEIFNEVRHLNRRGKNWKEEST